MRSIIKIILAIGTILAVAGLVYFFSTFSGLYQLLISRWEEEKYKGKPLRELEVYLSKQNRRLEGADPGRIYPLNPELPPNQKVMEFPKGGSYKWFWHGTAPNVGYVLIEQRPNGPVILEIHRNATRNAL